MSSDKVNLYNQNQKSQLSNNANSRETDSRALSGAAARMEEAKRLLTVDQKSKEALKAWGEAIRHNQRLWTVFQVAVTDINNPLPRDLRVTLLNLARYVDRVSFRIVGKFVPDQIESLININRVLAAGLNKKPTGEAIAVPTPESIGVPMTLMTSA